MKKIDYMLIGGLLLAAVTLIPVSHKPSVTVEPVTIESVTAQPVNYTSDIRLNYVELEESTKEILDEVLCDYVSEEVVNLMDADIDYRISDWVDRDTHTYLFFEKLIPGHTSYTACGYVKTSDGTYAYFELSSDAPLTEEMVDTEIQKSFSKPIRNLEQMC